MARRLPPLNALRAFEAAARHLSFTKAAEELFVTQAAVSHQVKALEEHLGLQLFRRYNRRLMLTDAGQGYLPSLRDAFDSIALATEQLSRVGSSGSLTVSVLNSFAAKWLLPNLVAFREAHPEIDVLVSASDHIVDFTRDNVDMAIRYGAGNYPGLEVNFLMGDVVFPVCSPALLETGPPLRVPQDLQNHTLLHDTTSGSVDGTLSWAGWLKAAGVTGLDPRKGPGFTHSNLVLQAAIDGQGVALGRSALAGSDLEAGRLVRPFGPDIPSQYNYYIVVPSGRGDHAKINTFRLWLLRQAGQNEAEIRPPDEA